MTDEEKVRKSRFIRGILFEYVTYIIGNYETVEYKNTLCDKYDLFGEDRELFEKVLTDFRNACNHRAETLLKKEDM